MTYERTYRSGVQKTRGYLRSQTLSPANSPDEQGKEDNDTAPAPSTATRADNWLGGTEE